MDMADPTTHGESAVRKIHAAAKVIQAAEQAAKDSGNECHECEIIALALIALAGPCSAKSYLGS